MNSFFAIFFRKEYVVTRLKPQERSIQNSINELEFLIIFYSEDIKNVMKFYICYVVVNPIKKVLISILFATFVSSVVLAQEIVPLNEKNWTIQAQAHVFENYKGKDAIYIQQGSAILKDTTFKDGTIEFDVYLTERQSFPGVYFRAGEDGDQESFYLRPHQSGNPDANQAAPSIGGITAWQLYFGPTYSFPYKYKFNGWTHIKLVVNGKRAQVYLDYSKKPHLSWNLKLPPREGKVSIGGSFAPVHYADFKIDKNAKEIVDFKVIEPKPIKDIIQEWEISDKI